MESVYNAAPIGKHPDGLCLLSLDGGGVRGLSILYILRAIMARLNVERQEANLPPVRPCEVFDLIGGTSTGGLIAIMLGRLEMDVEECIDTYSGLSQKIFSQKQNRFGFGWKGDLKGRFSAENLEEAISKVVSDKGFNNSDPLDNGKPPGCRVMVCACARETQGTTRLRSYNLPGKPAPKVPPSIVGAARATSAATRFFDPVTIGNRTYVDGALSANNPIDEVEDEAASIWCPTTRDLKPHVKCFISIGTGNPGKHSIQDHSALKFLSETLVQMVTETEKTANKFASRWREQIEKKVYFRFNVQQGLQDVSLEAYSKEGIIEATTEEYLEESEVALRLGHCVQGLIDKQTPVQSANTLIPKFLELQIHHPSRMQRISNRWEVSFGKLSNDILHKISDYDPDSIFKSIYYDKCPGTTSWIISHPTYRAWKERRLGLMWLSGKIGSGKTFLTTTVIEDLHETGREFVGNFFFRSSDSTKMEASSLFRSFIAQILAFLDALGLDCQTSIKLSITRLFGPRSVRPTFNEIFREGFLPLHSCLVDHVPYCTYVVDGIDICQPKELHIALNALRKLSKPGSCLVFLSARDTVTLQDSIQESSRIHISEDDTRSDIQTFIEWRIEEKTQDIGPLTLNDLLLQEVKNILNEKAHLMILWVNLQLEALWESSNDFEIREAIRHLPEGLAETYARCIGRLNPTIGLNILKWACAALTPFHIDQLREALAIDALSGRLQRDRIPERHTVLKACANLVILSRDELVLLAHHSVSQFLTGSLPELTIDLKKSRSKLTDLFVVHLTGSDYALELARPTEKVPVEIDTAWLIPAMLPTWSKKFVSNKKTVLHMPNLTPSTPISTSLPSIFYYARMNWAPLTRDISPSTTCWDLFLRLALQPNLSYNLCPWKTLGVSIDSHYIGLLGYAVAENHTRLLHCLMYWANPKPRKEIFDLPLPHYENTIPLHLAMRLGSHEVLADLLLEYNVCDVRKKDHEKWTSLHHAVRGGCSSIIVDRLIREGVKVEAKNADGLTALGVAAAYGQTELVKHLVQKNADKEGGRKRGETPLFLAARNGHLPVVQVLTACGADCNVLDQHTRETPLIAAAKNGHDAVIRVLRDVGAYYTVPGSATGEVDTPLAWACRNGHEASVYALLSAPFKFNQLQESMDTLIWLATKNGHGPVVRALIEAGANIETTDSKGNTPLLLASMRGFESVVRTLLELGADMEAFNDAFQKPLLLASQNGHSEAVRVLVEAGANKNVIDTAHGQRPLHLATENGHKGVVDILIGAGADVRATDYANQRVLHTACKSNNQALVQALVEGGALADIESRDKNGRTPLLVAINASEFWGQRSAEEMSDGQEGNFEVVQYLINTGAGVNVEDVSGATPLSRAIQGPYTNKETIKFLIQKGANMEKALYLIKEWCFPSGYSVIEKTAIRGHVMLVWDNLQRHTLPETPMDLEPTPGCYVIF